MTAGFPDLFRTGDNIIIIQGTLIQGELGVGQIRSQVVLVYLMQADCVSLTCSGSGMLQDSVILGNTVRILTLSLQIGSIRIGSLVLRFFSVIQIGRCNLEGNLSVCLVRNRDGKLTGIVKITYRGGAERASVLIRYSDTVGDQLNTGIEDIRYGEVAASVQSQFVRVGNDAVLNNVF